MENCSLIKSTFLINPKLSKFQFGDLQLTFEGVKTHHEILIFEFFFSKHDKEIKTTLISMYQISKKS